MNLLSLASHELRRAADLVDKIEKMKKELSAVLASSTVATKTLRRKRRMSAAGRLAIAAAQKVRWAKMKVKSVAKHAGKKPGKRKMSAAAKAKLSVKMKTLWAARKAAKK